MMKNSKARLLKPLLCQTHFLGPLEGLLLVHANSVLGLVEHALSSTAVDVLILGATELVGDFLAGRLGVVRLDTAV